MKPAPFEYLRPESVDEALAVLAEHGLDAKVIAGGQSLVPLLNMRFARPEVLVDVNRLPALDGIDEEQGSIRVGALVRQAAFEASPIVRARAPLAALCVPFVGHFVTRNRGTVGGSIAHADARAELPLVLTALGGAATVASTRGRRVIRAEELFVTHFTSALEPDELLLETVWPCGGPDWGFAFEEFALRRGDYALGMAACALCVRDGRVTEARLAIGATVDRPRLLDSTLEGAVVTQELARAVGARAAASVDPVDSLHASAAYQRHLTGLVVERSVLGAWRDATGSQA